MIPTGYLLPRCPSRLIRLAIQDARGLDRQRYTPRSTVWHHPKLRALHVKGCAICFAGAVMAGTFEADPRNYYTLHSFPGNASPLRALELFRCESWAEGMRALMIPEQRIDKHALSKVPQIRCRIFTGWDEFEIFLGSMEKAAVYLDSLGL